MGSDTALIWGIGFILVLAFVAPYAYRLRRREQETEAALDEAIRYGLHEPVSLHPVVDMDRCIGSAGCVDVCPEHVLGLKAGQAVAVAAAHCIGHGLCERACPVEAIRLVFGTERRGIELPRIKENFETNVPGLYVVGELGGMGLVANAFEQGRQCVEGLSFEDGSARGEMVDVAVVGCGPAGLSASLTALQRRLRVLTLEKEDIGGTVRSYPRKKMVMTRPVKIPTYGKLPLREIQKEELVSIWERVVLETGLEVRTGETVTGVERHELGGFRLTTDRGEHWARYVLLAIGRRGVPRKLGVPGEDSPNVAYSLREPEAFSGDRILVVGGGDSAVEAALALAEQPDNQVRLSYRGNVLRRIKTRNQQRVTEAVEAGRLEILWSTLPREIFPNRVSLSDSAGTTLDVPADRVFIFAGGSLPTEFLRACGVELDTHFGSARGSKT